VVHHAVEKARLFRAFPELIGVISEKELISLVNFSGIPNEYNSKELFGTNFMTVSKVKFLQKHKYLRKSKKSMISMGNYFIL
jgi:hypothetical protein